MFVFAHYPVQVGPLGVDEEKLHPLLLRDLFCNQPAVASLTKKDFLRLRRGHSREEVQTDLLAFRLEIPSDQPAANLRSIRRATVDVNPTC